MTFGRARIVPIVVLLGVLAAPSSWAAAPAGTAPAAPPAATVAPAGGQPKAPAPPASVPVPEIAKQAEELTKQLREVEALAAPASAIDAIRERLPEATGRIGPEVDAADEAIMQALPPAILDRYAQALRASRAETTDWVETLTKRATQLEEGLKTLATLRATWTQARADAQASRAPVAVVQRVDTVLADIEATRGKLEVERTATLLLQNLVAQEVARCEAALARIADFRLGALTRKLVRTTPPIWSPEMPVDQLAALPAYARQAAETAAATFGQFVADHVVALIFHALTLVALIVAARAARRRARAAAAAGEEAPSAAVFVDRPYSSAVLGALALIFLYPDRPRTVVDLFVILTVLPMVRIVRPRVAPALVPALYGFAALLFVDRLRAEMAVVPVVDQVFLLVEMLAASAGLAWLLASGRLLRASGREGVVLGAAVGLVACAASFVAAAYGAVPLARDLGAGFVVGLFIALGLYSIVRVIDALVAFLLRARPLRGLGMVARHGAFLEARVHRVLCWIAVPLWLIAELRFLAMLEPALTFAGAVLAAEVRRGNIGVSLGDVLGFALTVWIAFVVSAGIRFALEEDVYPRLRVARGPAYVVSSLVHYAIVFLGFLLAVAALGVDLTKATILAGAFGVGIGFGLQGMVNNVVSGLIVLLERPVNVGDAIELGTLGGEVRRIGLRATTVRTWEGAEVIIPNASLVSEKVTNWTHSDRLRRMSLKVGVAYGTPPDKVLELLRGVAAAHPGVLATPAPLAVFVDFGDSALDFELQAWTNRFDRWVEIRSELGVAVYEALQNAGIEVPFPQREVRLRS